MWILYERGCSEVHREGAKALRTLILFTLAGVAQEAQIVSVRANETSSRSLRLCGEPLDTTIRESACNFIILPDTHAHGKQGKSD